VFCRPSTAPVCCKDDERCEWEWEFQWEWESQRNGNSFWANNGNGNGNDVMEMGMAHVVHNNMQ